MTLTTEQLSAVETTKEFRALLKYMRAIAKAEPESVKEKFELEEGLWRYASQKTIKAIVGHIDALEFALAANREAQPVFFIEIEGDDWINAGRIQGKDRPDLGLLPDGINYLYATPPAPAVPDESDPRDAFESVFPMPKYVVRCGTGYAVTAYSAWGAHDFKERWEGWNSCRAEMLENIDKPAPQLDSVVTRHAEQPVSGGYTVQDGWIPCSEQTPVADGAYWCWFGKEKPSVIQQRVCIWNDRNHEWCDSAVTHWMPLPAAPEGGNG